MATVTMESAQRSQVARYVRWAVLGIGGLILVIAVLGNRFGIRPPGYEKVAPDWPTLGDVDSAEALAAYQAGKRAHKAAMRAEAKG